MKRRINKIAVLEKIFFLICFVPVLFLYNGCGKQEDETNQGSVCFYDISVEIGEDGSETLFVGDEEKFFVETVELFMIDYAIYNNQVYSLAYQPGQNTDFLPTQGKYMIRCCSLQENSNQAKDMLELIDMVDREDFGKSFIQEGLLYCSWRTKENIQKYVVVNLDSGMTTEFSVPEGRVVGAVTMSGYYYLQDGKIYFSEYEGGKDKLFFETDGQVCEMYRDGENFCAFVEREEGISVAVLNEKGKQQEEYGGIDQVEGLQKGYSPVFLKEKNGILYYLLTAKKEGTSYNTWLIRADLKEGIRTNCGGWYVKQEN